MKEMLCKDVYKATLIGGAIGDAIGYAVEFLSYNEITRKYGINGISDMPEQGIVSDDTQMTLFTVEGLLRAICRGNHKGICHIPSVVYYAYLRWYYTQTKKIPIVNDVYKGNDMKDFIISGSLIKNEHLYSREAPGNTCLTTLSSGYMGKQDKPLNKSKGCGGVMRVAPIGLLFPNQAFSLACDCAAITHSHLTGYIAAGAFAQIISYIASGESIINAINNTITMLKDKDINRETTNAIEDAIELSKSPPSVEKLSKLGEGWIAEEALSIALYCCLCYPSDFEKAVLLSVNHSGDSDSTGSICGNIMGAKLGLEAIRQDWIDKINIKGIIFNSADDMQTRFENNSEWWDKYPGY